MRAVYATDLSEAIEAAIGTRTCLGCLDRYGIDAFDFVTVTSPNVTAGMPGSNVSRWTRDALDRQRNLLEREGFEVETHVVRGTPHRRIDGFAERVDADLVIVGSRWQSPLERRLIGGTARNVARASVRPLLVQRIVELADDLETRGIETQRRVREGVTADERLAAEAEFEPTTILLGARGRSPMRRLLRGSVSEDVTGRADSNVLLVPPTRVRQSVPVLSEFLVEQFATGVPVPGPIADYQRPDVQHPDDGGDDGTGKSPDRRALGPGRAREGGDTEQPRAVQHRKKREIDPPKAVGDGLFRRNLQPWSPVILGQFLAPVGRFEIDPGVEADGPDVFLQLPHS